ncbi:MAG: hypothetical protein IPO21_02175 [Bacteroidales bacterium]|nr:hypothetical protein [Bacteroidales bacterium]
MQYAIDSSIIQNKKVLLFFDSDWSATGNIMKHTTFNDTAVVKMINNYFIPVLFSATSKDPVVYSNKTYINEGKEHPFHQFAVDVLKGNMAFPVFALLTKEHTIIQVIPGYFTEESILPIIEYFGSDSYISKPWEEFMAAKKNSK